MNELLYDSSDFDELLYETPKWKLTEKEREVMAAAWMQIKGACEKIKEDTNAQNKHIRKMLQKISDRYYL